jgi:hypothetical protein
MPQTTSGRLAAEGFCTRIVVARAAMSAWLS